MALSVVQAAGGALAGGPKKAQLPPQQKPILTEADKPKTCADQCKVLEKILVEPCKQEAGDKKQEQDCVKDSKSMIDACYGSCKEKGRVDKQYVLEHYKPPANYKGAQGGGSGNSEEHDDAH